LVTLLGFERCDIDLMLGLDLDWTTLRTGVFQLHRVVVPPSQCYGAKTAMLADVLLPSGVM
jgi:hypothetical protein